MATKIDKEACREAYNLVRDDGSAVIWVTFKYDGSTIVPGEQGAEYSQFIQQCTAPLLQWSLGSEGSESAVWDAQVLHDVDDHAGHSARRIDAEVEFVAEKYQKDSLPWANAVTSFAFLENSCPSSSPSFHCLHPEPGPELLLCFLASTPRPLVSVSRECIDRRLRGVIVGLLDDVRLFAFVRFTTGDAMSKRSKFALITWIGENVSGLQRAKTGTDKTLVKEVVQNFAKEFVISDRKELEEDFIKSELKKAGGANYDAQTE
ncbi:Coactosin-like protein [Tupaia chinensis]|uniref:Coactosin-like protein n=1 Tax=Tupaia chinensis TaxID=246437 RepID=L9KKC3_TUPCH|nr:Coactosin-like protein [Tupaia chinensis]